MSGAAGPRVEVAWWSPAAWARWLWDHPTVIVVLALLMLVWWIDYAGRVQVVDAARASCERSSDRLVTDVNNLRGDVALLEAQARSDAQVAATPGVPAGAKRARRAVVMAERQAVARKLAEIRTTDRQIDQGLWREMADPWDQAAVRDGVPVARRREAVYRCSAEHPSPPLLTF